MKLSFDFTYADGQVIDADQLSLAEGVMNNLFQPKNRKENVFYSTLGPIFMLM
jgi:hypothetical protein